MSIPVVMRAQDVCWEVDGRRVVGPLNLGVERGECLAIVGPNGAGKSTLLRLLAGLIEPTTGTLTSEQDSYSQISRRELARRVAFVPQSRAHGAAFTVKQWVLLGRFPHASRWQIGVAPDDLRAVNRALSVAGALDIQDRQLGELSGGEQQVVHIAAALAQEAGILLLDEPTTHLDPQHQRQITSLLLQLNREADCSIVVATHDLNFAGQVGDRILALRDGRELICDVPEKVISEDLLGRLFEAPFTVMRRDSRLVALVDYDS